MQDISAQAFEKLFRLYHKELTSLAYNLLRDKDIAKDAVQEVFFKLWKNKSTIDFTNQIKHYLFKATAHTALNYLRAAKKNVPLEKSHEGLGAGLGIEDTTYTEMEARVREAVDKLPPKCKAIFLLSRNEGLKYKQIADTLDLSIKTVENQMGIALEKLRKDLKPFLSREFLMVVAAALFSLLYPFMIKDYFPLTTL